MTINKWLRYFIYGGIFIVPFIPLYVASSMFFPFITGKNFAWRIIVEIILALWAILALRDKTARPQSSWLLYSVLALVVIDGLATFFGVFPYRSFWSNYERMDGYINILHLGAYFLVLVSMFKERVKWFWLANISLLANVYIVAYGFLQLAGQAQIHQSGTRLDASLGNSAYLAVYVLFHIFVAGYLLLSQWTKNKVLSAWYTIMIVANTIILYYTATRGAILGLIGGVILTCLLLAILSKGQTRKIAGGIIILILLLGAGFWSIKNTDFVKGNQVLSRFASISLSGGTTQSRFLIWNMSWQGFKERPVLGWGPENYPLVFAKYYDPKMWSQEPWFDRSHNIFFDWLINAGLLGLLAYLSIYVSLLYYLWFGRRGKTNSIIDTLAGKSLLTGLIAAYFFHNIFVFDNLISYILFFSLIAFAHFEMTEGKKEEVLKVKNNYQADKKTLANSDDDYTAQALSVVIVVAMCFVIYYANIKPIYASTNLIKALSSRQAGSATNFNYYQNVFNLNTFGSGEALEQLASRTIGVIGEAGVPDEVKKKFVQLTDEQTKKRLDQFSGDARSDLYFGSYLSTTGRVEEGLALLQKAQTLSPKKQQILFQLVSVYIQKQDAPSAIKTAEQAYNLDQTYPEARKIYALVLLMTNQGKLAQEILTPIKNTANYYNDARFKNLYEQAGDQASLQEILLLQKSAEKK
jgi:O-antigen ligase